MVLVAGCVVADRPSGTDGATRTGSDDVDIILRLRTPGGFAPPSPGTRSATRAMSYEAENAIETIHVMVFDQSETLTVIRRGEVLSSTTTGGDVYSGMGEFTVTLPSGEANETYTLAVFANLGDEATYEALAGSLEPGTSDYADVVATLVQGAPAPLYAAPGPAIGPGVILTPVVPMWGEQRGVALKPGSMNLSVDLTRAVARIDVGVGTPTRSLEEKGDEWSWDGENASGTPIPFTLSSVHVFRPNDRLSVMPDPAAPAGGPTIPAGTAPSTEPWAYGTITNSLYATRDIYVPEADVTMGDATPGGVKHTERMAIVIGGIYNDPATESDPITYYRADFIKEGRLIDVLRNRLYQFNITSVSGPGYPDPITAYEGESINMTVNVLDWDDAELNDIEWVGQRFFAFGERPVRFDPAGGTRSVVIRTNIEGGFTMTLGGTTITAPTVTGSPASPTPGGGTDFTYSLTLDGTVDGTSSYTLDITATHNFGPGAATRTDEWTVTTAGGRLTTPFEVIQTARDFYISHDESSTIHIPASGGFVADILASETLTPGVTYGTAGEQWLTVTPAADQNGFKTIRLTALPFDYPEDGRTNRTASVTLTRPGGRGTITCTVIQSMPPLTFYSVTVTPAADPAHGEGMADIPAAPKGTLIRLLARPEIGFAFRRWDVTSGGAVLDDFSGNPTTFNMPAANVTITPVFIPSTNFHFTLGQATGGTAIRIPERATNVYTPGEWISVTATPNPGWAFDRWSHDGLEGIVSADDLKEPSIRFQMPGDNILLTPGYKQLYLHDPADQSWAAAEYDVRRIAINTNSAWSASITSGSGFVLTDASGNPVSTPVTGPASDSGGSLWVKPSGGANQRGDVSFSATITVSGTGQGSVLTSRTVALRQANAAPVLGAGTNPVWGNNEQGQKSLTLTGTNVAWSITPTTSNGFSVSPTTGTGATTVTITRTGTNQTVVPVTATFTLSATDAATDAITGTKTITATQQPAAPSMIPTPGSLAFAATDGPASTAKEITVGGNLAWSATIPAGAAFTIGSSAASATGITAGGAPGAKIYVKAKAPNTRGDVTIAPATITITSTTTGHTGVSAPVTLTQATPGKTWSVTPTAPAWEANQVQPQKITVNTNVAWRVALASGSGFRLSKTSGGTTLTEITGTGPTETEFWITPAGPNTLSTTPRATYTVSATAGGVGPATVTATQGPATGGDTDIDGDGVPDWRDENIGQEI